MCVPVHYRLVNSGETIEILVDVKVFSGSMPQQDQEIIAYQQTDESESDHKCGPCHICPTFLGICYFIWLAVIVAVIIVMMRRKKET